jgi:hypothetical protein
MKRLNLTICVIGLLLGVTGTVVADTWQVVYQTDFSSDPGWITNNSSRHHWDSSDGTFYVNQVNINGGGEYAYYDMSQVIGSFRLEWDIKMLATNYASDVRFGIFDTGLDTQDTGTFACVYFTLEDRGRTIHMASLDREGKYHQESWLSPQFSDNVWYHVIMEYDASTSTLTTNITVRDTGEDFAELQATNVSPFGADMDRIGTSNVRKAGFQCPGADSVGKIDNVVLYAFGPGENDPPVANSGDDIVADANEEVTLDASNSRDPDGQIIKYTWKRLPDGVIIYSGKEPTCQTKALGRVEEIIELTVTDDSLATATDTLKIISRTTQELKDQLAAMQSQIEQLQQQSQETRDLVDRICAWPPIKWWLRRAIRLGDLNQDGAVNMSDFALLAKDWLH